jgi:hypothetical protein
MDTSRAWLLDVSTRISAVMGKRIAATDPTRMTASLSHIAQFKDPIIYRLLTFESILGAREDDKIEFRLLRWSRNSVTKFHSF